MRSRRPLLQGHALRTLCYQVKPPAKARCPHCGQTRFNNPSKSNLPVRQRGHFWPGRGIPHDRVLRETVVQLERDFVADLAFITGYVTPARE